MFPFNLNIFNMAIRATVILEKLNLERQCWNRKKSLEQKKPLTEILKKVVSKGYLTLSFHKYKVYHQFLHLYTSGLVLEIHARVGFSPAAGTGDPGFPGFVRKDVQFN